jgi:cell division protein FtsB
MSDIDRTRMIPLHIADQAVAACDAEIAKLREENARLKAEVERLEEDNRQLTNAFEIAEGIIKRMGKAAEAAAKEGKSSV